MHVTDPAILKETWANNLKQHQITEAGQRKINALRSAATAMSAAYIDLVPGGRDQARALTHNQEALEAAITGVQIAHAEQPAPVETETKSEPAAEPAPEVEQPKEQE